MPFGIGISSGSDSSFMAHENEEIEVGPETFLPLHAQDALRLYGEHNNTSSMNPKAMMMHRTSSQSSMGSTTNTSTQNSSSYYGSVQNHHNNNNQNVEDTSMISHDSGYAGDTSYTAEDNTSFVGGVGDVSYYDSSYAVDNSMEVQNTSFVPASAGSAEDISQSHHSLPSPEEAATHHVAATSNEFTNPNPDTAMAMGGGTSPSSFDHDNDDQVGDISQERQHQVSSFWHSRRRLILSVTCLVLAVAAVLIGVLVGLQDDEGTTGNDSNKVVIDPDNPNDFPPTPAPIAPSDDEDFPYFPPPDIPGDEDGIPEATPEPLDPTNYCPLSTEMDGIPISNFNDSVVLYGTTVNTTLIGENNNPNATRPLPTCSDDIDAYGRGLWYTVRGPGAVVVATTCRSLGLTWNDGPSSGNRQPLDTQLTVFSSPSSRCTDGLQCVTANDDASCGVQSTVSWYAEEGRLYFIYVSGKPQPLTGEAEPSSSSNVIDFEEDRTENGETVVSHPVGSFTLTLSLAPIGTCDAAIDYQSEAETLSTFLMDPSQQTQVPTSSSMIVGSLLGAKIGLDPCAPGEWLGRGGEIWYKATGTGGWLMASTCHDAASNANEFPPRLALYKGNCDQVECGLAKASEAAPSVDRDCGLGYSLNWWSELGIEYYIMVYKTNFLPGIQFGLTVEDLNPPGNDNCTGAIRLSANGAVTYGSTLRATYTPESVAPTCTRQAVTHSHPGVWYSVVGTGERLTASVCNEVTKYDTKISVYEGSCTNLTCVNGNDQWCGYQSSVDWESSYGTVYFILVHGSTGGTQPSMGDFGLAVYEFLPTVNDYCSDATPLEPGTVTRGSTSTASPDDYVEACDQTSGSTGNQAPGVWFRVEGNGGGLRASTCTGTDFDTKISIYRGDDCQRLQCLTSDDNGCGFQSSVYWSSMEFETYYILVHGNLFSSFGDFTLTIETYSPNTINDFCTNALPALTNTMNIGSTKNATFDGVGTCVVANTAPGTWYSFVGTGTGLVATTCHSVTDFDTRISVFRGDVCEQLECVAGNDDSHQSEACGSSAGSRVSWLSEIGAKYYILIHGWGELVGTFGLTIEEVVPVVPNDYCITSMNVTVTRGGNSSNTLQQPVVVGSNIDATVDNVPICGDVEAIGHGVWYRGVGTGNRLVASTCNRDSDNVDSNFVTFNTLNPGVWTDFDTQISVFRGGCRTLECAGANNDRCGSQSSVNFFMEEGESFYVLVHGAAESKGNFGLVLEEIFPQVANDFCDTATPLALPFAGGTNQIVGTSAEASYDTVTECVVPNTSPGVWYTVTGTGREIVVTTCGDGTDFDTRLTVFTGSCQRLECVTGNDDTNRDTGSCGLASTVSWPSVEGQVYYIRVHGWGSLVGIFQLGISEQLSA